ncbi:MAG TPA: S1/P1 nuclease [Thermoanaerobaculia bacterium]|nr:S1/P1 nuclease [Thermoanaerobaculia bacterium]
MSVPDTPSAIQPEVSPTASLFDREFFGIERHELIAEVAGTLLTSQHAKKQVRRILDLLKAGSLGDIAGWADRVKRREPSSSDDPETFAFLSDKRNRNNASWHFVNLPLDADSYSRERYPQFTGPEDVVQMTNHCISALLGQPDRFSEANALRLLTHLVGDLHQPIHVGCCYLKEIPGPTGARLVRDPDEAAKGNLRNDQGGNRLVLPLPGNPSLHSYWDSALGESEHHHDEAHALASQPAETDNFETPRFVADAGTRSRYVARVRETVLSTALVLADPPDTNPDPLSLATSWAGESLMAARSAYESIAIASQLNGGKFRVDWEGKAAYDARNAPLIRKRIESASRNLALLLDTIWP